MSTYFYNNAVGYGAWDDLGSWWNDADFTSPASALPATGDDVYIEDQVTIGPSLAVVLGIVYISQATSNGSINDLGGYYGAPNLSAGNWVVGTASGNSGTLNSVNYILSGDVQAYGGSTIGDTYDSSDCFFAGNVTCRQSSGFYGTTNNPVSFYDASSSGGFNITGIFHDASIDYGYNGSSTFTESRYSIDPCQGTPDSVTFSSTVPVIFAVGSGVEWSGSSDWPGYTFTNPNPVWQFRNGGILQSGYYIAGAASFDQTSASAQLSTSVNGSSSISIVSEILGAGFL